MKNEYFKRLWPLATIVLVTLLGRFVITGGLPMVELGPASPLAGAVSASYVASGNKTYLPIENTDYTIQDIRYFDDKSWVVASIKPALNDFNDGTVVLRLIDGGYRVVLGPGTAFSSEYLQSMPNDVAGYLKTQGAIYEPVD